MTYQKFLNCLEEYRDALLGIIPAFYEEENTSNFPSIHNVNGKTYFRSTEKLEAEIKARKNTPLKHPEDEAKRKKELTSLKEDLKQNKRWVDKCSEFVEYMTKYVLTQIDPIAKECTPLLFRFRFFDEEIAASIYSQKVARSEFKKNIQRGLDKGKDEDMAFSIFLEFMVYLKLLKDKYDKYETSAIIKRKIVDQEKNYLDVSGEKIKKFIGGKAERSKNKKRASVGFNDVKLEITVGSNGTLLLDAIVSANKVSKESLRLQDRFHKPLYLLAKAVKDGACDGWVFNKYLQEKCKGETPDKIKFAIKKAFIDLIGKRAETIIEIRRGCAKKLMIPTKNIKIMSVK
jgi:hypothetical protein